MSAEIFKMIVNWPVIASEVHLQQAFDLDTLLDFVIEHVGDTEIFRFDDLASILNWLYTDESQWNQIDGNDQLDSVDSSVCQPCNDTTIASVLKPGTKITIRKPSASDIKFQDLESVQAYLNKGSVSSYQSSNDDSEEVDVITDDFTPTWNSMGTQYFIEATSTVPPKSRKNSKVLTENQSNVANLNVNARKKVTIKSDLVEATYKCSECDKKYKQKSSLLRHSKSHLPKEPGNEHNKKPTNKRTNNKNNMNGTTHVILPLNTAEPISTWTNRIGNHFATTNQLSELLSKSETLKKADYTLPNTSKKCN